MTAESKACSACAKAKRKCGKQIPACQRCREKGMECEYLPSKPSCFVPLDQDPTFSHWSLLNGNVHHAPTLTTLDQGVFSRQSINIASSADWFLSPETWRVDHGAFQVATSFTFAALRRYVKFIQDWFEDWVKTGGNPFIHSYLYQTRIPGCVQVAFTTMSSYISKTEKNTELVLRIVQDRANELLLENGVSVDHNIIEN